MVEKLTLLFPEFLPGFLFNTLAAVTNIAVWESCPRMHASCQLLKIYKLNLHLIPVQVRHPYPPAAAQPLEAWFAAHNFSN